MDRRAWFALLVLAAIWGASYLLIKIGIRDLSPEMVAWLRIALAAAVLVTFAHRAGLLRSPRGQLGTLALVGAVQVAAPFVLIAWGEEEVSSSLAGILVASTPLFTALLAIRLDAEERSEGLRLLGILLGLVGVGLLLGLDLSGSGAELAGGLAILLASLGYAVGAFILKHRLRGRPPLDIAAWVMVASAIMLAPLAALGAPAEAPGPGPLAAVAALGVLGTGIAFAIFYTLMDSVGPARTFIVTFLAPGFAVVYGAVLLGEAISAATIAGLALILLGSWSAVEGGVSPLALLRGRRARAPTAAEAGPVPAAPPAQPD